VGIPKGQKVWSRYGQWGYEVWPIKIGRRRGGHTGHTSRPKSHTFFERYGHLVDRTGRGL